MPRFSPAATTIRYGSDSGAFEARLCWDHTGQVLYLLARVLDSKEPTKPGPLSVAPAEAIGGEPLPCDVCDVAADLGPQVRLTFEKVTELDIAF